MSKPIIEMHDLSKLYRLGSIGYTTLREALQHWRDRHRTRSAPTISGLDPSQFGPYPHTFWAVQGITAAIEPGQIIGIVGRNGAGKSTLLKLLSRITDPTKGRAILRGRVGSLLEVGAGFHPDLSGRDNIFLNGAILGMKRAAILRELENIIDFADIGPFIDTPIKRYSSGMYVRLAFAVAAHLDPEILILDEVLAVGDARFQKRCLGKMRQIVSDQGRTVVFVSHNLEAVQRLCSHCMLLDRGQLAAFGPTQSIVTQYLGANLVHAAPDTWIDLAACPREGAGPARFAQMRFTSLNPATAGHPYSDGPLEFELAIDAPSETSVQSIAVGLRDEWGRRLVNIDVGAFGQTIKLVPGRTTVRLRAEQLHLRPGVYQLALWLARYPGGNLGREDIYDYLEKAAEVEVVQLVSGEPRTGIGPTGVVTCDFKLLEVVHESGPAKLPA